MKKQIAELMDIVAAGDDLACEDAAFLCQQLDPFAWRRALERAARQSEPEPSPSPSLNASEAM